jgi:hypothetical protein
MRFVKMVVHYASLAIGVLAFESAAAQDWIEYRNPELGFAINFPGEPSFEDIEYASPSGEIVLPARVFTVLDGDARYSVTVVDYAAHLNEQHVAIVQAADAMHARGEVVHEVIGDLDEVFGVQSFVIEADGRQALSSIYFFNERLYIVHGSVASNARHPVQFQQSLGIMYADGTRPNGAGSNPDRIARQRAYEEQQRQLQQQEQ